MFTTKKGLSMVKELTPQSLIIQTAHRMIRIKKIDLKNGKTRN